MALSPPVGSMPTFYRHINLWDVAGGLAIVAEAGGMVSDFMAGDAAGGNALLVATPALYEPLHRMFLRVSGHGWRGPASR